MTAPAAPPPGWYPDPEGVLRWWDGRAWSTSGVREMRPRVPEGTSTDTGWAWGIVAAALLGIVQSVWTFLWLPGFVERFVDLAAEAIESVRRDPYGGVVPRTELVLGALDPITLLGSLVGWGLVVVAVVFAYLDHRELAARGFDRPFPWLWSLLGGIVYMIGRGVVVHNRSGRGLGVTWVYVAVTVASYVAAMAWSVWFVVWFTAEVLRRFLPLMSPG